MVADRSGYLDREGKFFAGADLAGAPDGGAAAGKLGVAGGKQLRLDQADVVVVALAGGFLTAQDFLD